MNKVKKNYKTVKSVQLEKIWNQFNHLLRNFILSKSKDNELAEVMLHEVYVKMHDSLASIKHPEKIKNWLFQITRNTIIDCFRSKKNQVSILENRKNPRKIFSMRYVTY
jgi:RNA polymerase sigma-70 factor (ECF subfamily)